MMLLMNSRARLPISKCGREQLQYACSAEFQTYKYELLTLDEFLHEATATVYNFSTDT